MFQVRLHGFELIEIGPNTMNRPGHGRLFIGLEEDQSGALRNHIEDNGIATTVVNWGNPTLVIRDLDGNELFFWYSGKEREQPSGARPSVCTINARLGQMPIRDDNG